MKPVDTASTPAASTEPATRQLSAVRAKLLQETSQQFAHKDVFPPSPPTPAQQAEARADHGAPIPGPAATPARVQKASHHSVDTRA
jgi:hypothetical protein